MARQIVVSIDGTPSTFDFSKVDRSKLYGRRRRLPLDPKGNPCTRASLTEDGSQMIRSGMTSQGYFTPDGYWVPNKELVGLDSDGKEVDKVESTLGVEQELSEAKPEEVLDLKIISVYGLDPTDDVDDDLMERLEEGEIFRFSFNYRADFQAETAFLVANDEGEAFALVGRMAEPLWYDPEETVPTFEEDDEDDDDGDLDFEMF